MEREQINQIVFNINSKLKAIDEADHIIENTCDPDFLHGRKKYPVTAVVYSAFDEEKQNISGFQIQKVNYGRGLFLPALDNGEMHIEVYGESAEPWKNTEVKTKFNSIGKKLHLLIFSLKENRLSRLQLFSLDGFDEKGNVHVSRKEILWQSSDL